VLKVAVITISDRASAGEYEDRSGPVIEELLRKSGLDIDVSRSTVPDDTEGIRHAIMAHCDRDYIITTGGTGIGPRDVTPEVTEELCDYELPGLSEYLRHESIKETPFAVFSRGYCGVRESTIIVNLPGSVNAVSLCTRLLLPLLEHGKKMLSGEGH
jgi:molybdopterin adenylyltransferase